MNLTDWIVILAIALLAIAFFCPRPKRHATLVDRARLRLGTRLVVQAALALWGALFTLERCLAFPHALPFGLSSPPGVMLGVALGLALAGGFWSIRGARLLRSRRLFGAC
ncbi:hypothetical protein [Paraburkholderia sp. J12]|uniref:hypothetical protein n=1 Tax=Paraburkholderia sp. J12 TaxID=2805432 RepID=UPI002ABE434D|nr:hypothetical protein [Paraburkholderia sp. J12]